MLTSNEIFDRMLKIMNVERDVDLLKALGVKQTTFSTWRTRGTIPYKIIMDWCMEHGVPLEDVFVDNPKKVIDRIRQGTITGSERELLSIFRSLPEQEKETVLQMLKGLSK